MSKEPKEYTVVYAPDRLVLLELVNGLVGEGWEPFGSLEVIANTYSNRSFYQPMVRYDKE